MGLFTSNLCPQVLRWLRHYLWLLKRLCDRIRREISATKNCFLLHENAPFYTSGIVTQFLLCCPTCPIHRTLLSVTIFLFSHLKKFKQEEYDDLGEIQVNIIEELKLIPLEDFSQNVPRLYERSTRCKEIGKGWVIWNTGGNNTFLKFIYYFLLYKYHGFVQWNAENPFSCKIRLLLLGTHISTTDPCFVTRVFYHFY